jgi:hypothetical protein
MNTTFKLWHRKNSKTVTPGPIVSDVSAVSRSQTLNLKNLKTPADNFYEQVPKPTRSSKSLHDVTVSSAPEVPRTSDQVEFFESALQIERTRPTRIDHLRSMIATQSRVFLTSSQTVVHALHQPFTIAGPLRFPLRGRSNVAMVSKALALPLRFFRIKHSTRFVGISLVVTVAALILANYITWALAI